MNEIAVKPGKRSVESLLCLYYVTGAHDMIRLHSEMGWGPVCYPEDVSSKQMVTAVTNWLRDNPKDWKEVATFGVVMAFNKNWPCQP